MSGVSCPSASPGSWLHGLLLFSLIASAQTVSAQESGELYQIGAVRVEQGPEIDGVLDDPVWQTAALVNEFVQQEPDEGAPATERTQVRVLYDGRTLFLGVHAFDSSPDGPIATEMRRDADRILEEDNFQIILDTFMDSRSAYMFVITPAGCPAGSAGVRRRRTRPTSEYGSGVNRDWDGVWSVSTTPHRGGMGCRDRDPRW